MKLRPPLATPLPAVDDHIVEPETREEMVRGRRVFADAAPAPHADRHFKLNYILAAHLKPGYVGSSDLLTRQAEQSNFATDTCIRREGKDPSTGRRYLEEVCFEVVYEQSLRDVTERAEDLVARGVRRVLAIFVEADEVREWSAEEGTWKKLEGNLEGNLEDPTLEVPLPLSALLGREDANAAVMNALLAKGNPVLVAHFAQLRRKSALGST